MNTTRLEAFSDGVISILLTLMVLNLDVPDGADIAAMTPLIPQLLVYVLSFIYVGIYWNNHHHMLQIVDRINGPVLWANLHLLFWLSLIPFTTAWVGRNPAAAWPAVFYGGVLLLAAVAVYVLDRAFIALHGQSSTLSQALGSNRKNQASVLLYVVAIAAAFVYTWIADALYVLVAAMWLVPDRRIERHLTSE